MAYSPHRTNTRPPTTLRRVEPHMPPVGIDFCPDGNLQGTADNPVGFPG